MLASMLTELLSILILSACRPQNSKRSVATEKLTDSGLKFHSAKKVWTNAGFGGR